MAEVQPATSTGERTLPPRESEPLEHSGERGRTKIADAVVAKIAGIAAREVNGVHELVAKGAGGAVSSLTQRVTGIQSRAHGVNVEVSEREAVVDLVITVDYGANVAQVAEAVRRNVTNRIQTMTGLSVNEVNIEVSDLYFPEAAEETPQERRAA
jgi:uncharacterized alkaline shock family protein YloU